MSQNKLLSNTDICSEKLSKLRSLVLFKMNSRIVKLKTGDGKITETTYDVARLSLYIKDRLFSHAGCTTEEQFLSQENPKDDEVLLTAIRADILVNVLKWCKHHRKDPVVVYVPGDRKRSDDIPEWDRAFFNVDRSIVFDYIIAAYHLQIKGLRLNGCKTIANFMKGRTIEQLRKDFNVDCDFTPEEIVQVREENSYIEAME